ncbi:MAG: hypothetical protein K2X66_18105, partial [Cyanobacteria bacterium]|nr:hypothetical protein [Cyanobacteriota bacterium]
VASSLPRPLYNLNQKPSRPMPVLMINGTQDIAFPWEGGHTSIIGIKVGDVLPITDTLNYWLTVNGGASHQPDINTCKNEKNDGTKVEVSYFPTNQHACVIFYKVIGGGHTWPGGNIPLRYIPFLGKESQNLSASELIWEFFKRNALPEIPEISKPPLSQNPLSAEAN